MASNEIEVLDPEVTVDNLKQSAATHALDRRHFMAALGMAGAAAGAAMLTGCTTDNTVYPPYVTPGANQPNVVNFLLNVKYLKATLYSYVTTGNDISSTVTGGSGTITNAPQKLTFTGANAQQITDLFNEMYFDEISQLNTLRTSLGAQAVTRPAINLSPTGTVSTSNIIAIARALEDLSVTAFTGAVAALSSTSLGFALQTLSVDGFHAGALRLLSLQPSGGTPVKIDSIDVVPFDPGSATAAAAGPTSSGGFFATAGAASSSATVPQGSAFVRTTSQVLAFIYGSSAAGTTSGGYFPTGATGTFKSV